MNLLLTLIRTDWQLQWRQGLFYAALFVIALWISIFSQVPEVVLHYLLPIMLYIDLSIFGFFFMAGLLYLEKGEGTLTALVVTPVHGWHYLVAKLVTLTALGLGASLVIVAVIQPTTLNWSILVASLVLNSLFFTLISFAIAVRYNGIGEFLIPAILVLGVAQIPFVDSFDIWGGWPLYLLPFQAALLLVRAAFEPILGWQWLYAIVYLAAWIVLSYWWALRSFERFVVREQGGQP